VKRIFIALLALVASLSLTATPAQAISVDLGNGWTKVTPYGAAAKVINDCPQNNMCLFKDAYGWGTRCQTTVTNIRGGHTVPAACANNATSSYNRTGYGAMWFDGAHCESNLAKRQDGAWYAQTNWETRDFNNRISSWASLANWSGEYC
jgi:hypothetical protein